jgi:hypothetical protein
LTNSFNLRKGIYMNSRRSFIQLAGGGVVMAAALASLHGCASSSYPAVAVQAWQPADPKLEIRRWMLAHALLAPNPHNRQPWIADLKRDGEITLICDGERLLPETDPFGRQILVGCGAFIELAVLAAAERGFSVAVEVFPAGEPSLTQLPKGAVVAKLTVKQDASIKPDTLFAFILKRHTNKGAYDMQRPVSEANWKLLQASVGNTVSAGLRTGVVNDAAAMQKVRVITRESYEIETTTANTHIESAKLFRIGPDEIATHRDGISITGLMPRILVATGMFDRMAAPKKGDSNYQRMMDRWQAFETGSGYFWLASNGNSRTQQVAAGRAYVRTHLAATSVGIDMHPLSQALQEFKEVQKSYVDMHRLLGFDPSSTTVQMLARVGYGVKPSEATPRRDVKTMVI